MWCSAWLLYTWLCVCLLRWSLKYVYTYASADVHSVSWGYKCTLFHGNVPDLSQRVAQRRMLLSSHCKNSRVDVVCGAFMKCLDAFTVMISSLPLSDLVYTGKVLRRSYFVSPIISCLALLLCLKGISKALFVSLFYSEVWVQPTQTPRTSKFFYRHN